MHTIAGLILAMAMISASALSQTAQSKPAENAKPKTPAHAAATNLNIPIPDIKYTKFVLKNGLTVLVHEDHKAPIVAVNTWYHVGSKNEKPGKTGFAHLFEHLMFSGSENFNTDLHQRDGAHRRHQPERHHQQRPHQLL